MKEREKTLWNLPSTGSFPRCLQQRGLGQPEAGSQEVGAHSGSPMLGGKDFTTQSSSAVSQDTHLAGSWHGEWSQDLNPGILPATPMFAPESSASF